MARTLRANWKGQRPSWVSMRLASRVAGGGLLVATGAIHLDLYVTGYRTIPTIGWLFLVQVVVAFVLGTVVLSTGHRAVAALGAGFAASTLGGYLIALQFGLFGFKEVTTTAGEAAGAVEVAAIATLAALTLLPGSSSRRVGDVVGPGRAFDGLVETLLPGARWVAVGVTALAAVLLGVSSATGPTSAVPVSARAGRTLVKVATVGGTRVLVDARGFVLYWFVRDRPDKSVCYGTCANYWPPVTGIPVAGEGVTGTLGAIVRKGGAHQVTYNRHPLYRYIGDTHPGQAVGNGIDLNGGVWHEMVVSG